VDAVLLGSPVVGQLTDAEFRAWLALLAYVARWRGECDHVNGEFPRDWHRFTTYAKPGGKRPARVTKRHVGRFTTLGLLEELVDDAGKQWLRVVDWRDLHPLEWTGAIRQERWRNRHGYYGRRQVQPPREAE